LIQTYEILSDQGYIAEGEAILRDAMQRGEGKMSNYEKGRMCYYLGDYEQAAIYLEDARTQNTADVFLYLGRSYEAMGENNYASSVYNAYLSENQSDAGLYNQLGLCEIARGNYETALTALQAGIQLENPDMTQALLYNEIIATEYLGDFQTAKTLMETYLRKYPDDQNAIREYEFLQTR
jgi:tetratricopeptide (TPR) repeat protein